MKKLSEKQASILGILIVVAFAVTLILIRFASSPSQNEQTKATWLSVGASSKTFSLSLSQDGSTVAGWVEKDSALKPFKWSSRKGFEIVSSEGKALAVSIDGSTVVGYVKVLDSYQAFVWSDGSNPAILGTLGGNESWATGVSGDGRIVVGYSKNSEGITKAFSWSRETGMVELLSNGESYAYSVSADGSVIAGSIKDENNLKRAALWTEDGRLHVLPKDGEIPADGESEALYISADGKVIAGCITDNSGSKKTFIWKPFEDKFRIVKAEFENVPTGISVDGSYIFIAKLVDKAPSQAFVWNEKNGFVVSEEHVSEIFKDGSKIFALTGISADGNYLIGYGTNSKSGKLESFIVETPEKLKGGNNAPVLISLRPEKAFLDPNERIEIFCNVFDPNSDPLTYIWTSSGGTISGTGNRVFFTAPEKPGKYTVTADVADGNGGNLTKSIVLEVRQLGELKITGLKFEPSKIPPKGTAFVTCEVVDPENEKITYIWEVNGGSITGEGSQVNYEAPSEPGVYNVKVTVKDSKGRTGSVSKEILVGTDPRIRFIYADDFAIYSRGKQSEPVYTALGDVLELYCDAVDPDTGKKDNLEYIWEVKNEKGYPVSMLSSKVGPKVLFRADEYGTYTVTVRVSKGKDFNTSASIVVVVKEPEEIPYNQPEEIFELDTDSETNFAPEYNSEE